MLDRTATPINFTAYKPQVLPVHVTPTTNHNIYNRNESSIITGNVTYDPYNYTESVNATLDMGTSSTADDVTLILYDDGINGGDTTANDSLYTNYYNFSNSETAGIWNLTVTAYNIVDNPLNRSSKPPPQLHE